MDWSLVAQSLWNLLAGMVRRSKTMPENVHKNAHRGRILDALRHDPGKNLQRICDELGMKRGTASYHLYVLERAGAIGRHSSPYTTHFFPRQATEEERTGLTLLRRERAYEVVHKILERPGIRQKELLREIGMSRKVFRAYLQGFEQEGLLLVRSHGSHRHYTPTAKLIKLVDMLGWNGDDPSAANAPTPPSRPPW